MSQNPKFTAALQKMQEIHDLKNKDYSEDNNPYSNFEYTASTAGIGVEKVFLVQIGNKIARINELLKGKVPNNESLEDSLKDLAVYATLLYSYYMESE